MSVYRLTGNYGTFEVTKTVEAVNEDEAFWHTGIAQDLIDAGWAIDGPDGEEWTIEAVDA